MSIRWWRQYSFEDWLFKKYIDSTHELVRLAEKIEEYRTNLADINTLPDVVEGWQKTFGKVPKELGGDRGFHHPEKSQKDFGTQEILRLSIPYKGKRKHPESGSYWFKRLQRARASIEPIISHLKSEHRMGRCRYRGFEGDQINVTLATLAWNCKKWKMASLKNQ